MGKNHLAIFKYSEDLERSAPSSFVKIISSKYFVLHWNGIFGGNGPTKSIFTTVMKFYKRSLGMIFWVKKELMNNLYMHTYFN